MAGRDMLAQLFLGGRSPEEQAQRMARQRQQSGVGGGAAPPPLDMSAPGPWGAGQDPMSTGAPGSANVPIPTPRPDPMVMQTPTSAPSDIAPVIPTPSPGPPPGGMINPQQGAGMANGPIGSIGGPQSDPLAALLNGPIGSIGGGSYPQNAPIGSTVSPQDTLTSAVPRSNAPIGSIAQNAQPRADTKKKGRVKKQPIPARFGR